MIAGLTLTVAGLFLLGWAAHYRLVAVRKPHLAFNPSTFNRLVLQRLEQLQIPFRPTPWLYNAHLQLLWLLLREALTPSLRYDRTDVLTMRDGGTTALDWLGLDEDATVPTVVVLHSITGDAQSMRGIVADLRRQTGWRIVLCTRRGHGGLPLTAPVLNTMGSTDDLREQLQRIHAHFPESPLYAVGVSAGSALLVRYLGEEGGRSLIRAGIAYCPGYDISVAWSRVHRPYSRWMANRLKRHFLEPNFAMFGNLSTYRLCLATRDIEQFHQHFYEIAGSANVADYLERSNPVLVFDGVAVPVLILNADDDPVCVIDNALDHVETIRHLPDAMLVRTARGSHCAFFEGWLAEAWAHRLFARYLVAAFELSEHRRPSIATDRVGANRLAPES
ncbi:MAG: alpha/beta fold hydrolase [Sinimarinibacterium sp.]|jgi:hypothetical protein